MPQLPALPAPQDLDEFLDVHALMKNSEITALLGTLTANRQDYVLVMPPQWQPTSSSLQIQSGIAK